MARIKVGKAAPQQQVDPFGFISCFSRYAGSYATEMIRDISRAFNVQIVSEYEPEFWGAKTQKELDEWLEGSNEECERITRVEMLKYVRGEDNNLSPYSVEQGEIAKKLVRESPALLLAENQEKLWKEAKAVFAKRAEARRRRMASWEPPF